MRMPSLLKKWFHAIGDLPQDVAKKLETAGFGLPVFQTFLNIGWDSKLVAAVGLELSPDNKRITRGQFLLRGPLSREPVSLQACKLFPSVDPAITLTIHIPDGASFLFNSGTLCSDYLPLEDFKHHYSKGNTVILPTDWEVNGISDTCMRAIAHLDKASNGAQGPRIKTTILLFPRSTEELNQVSNGTQSPAWPGIRILQATCEFFPKFAAWGDPICPLILRGSPRDAAPNLPSGDEIRFHVAAVMKSARVPTSCTTNRGLAKQWARALEDVEAMEKEPSITWPTISRPVAEQGSSLFVNKNHIFVLLTNVT